MAEIDALAGAPELGAFELELDPCERTLEAQLREEVANVCFGGAIELRQMRRQIEAAGAQSLDLLVACESASRKLRRVIAAVLEAAERVESEPVPKVLPSEGELEGALAVRRMYIRFRRALRSWDGGDHDSVMNAVRYAAGALAAMVASADFSETRIADRRMLLGLHARLLGWARGQRDTNEGDRILSDIAATAELLRGVSRRQELRAHDKALIESLLADRPRDVAQVRRFLARARGLEGCDDQLDAEVARAVDSATPESLAGIRDTLSRLSRSMQH